MATLVSQLWLKPLWHHAECTMFSTKARYEPKFSPTVYELKVIPNPFLGPKFLVFNQRLRQGLSVARTLHSGVHFVLNVILPSSLSQL